MATSSPRKRVATDAVSICEEERGVKTAYSEAKCSKKGREFIRRLREAVAKLAKRKVLRLNGVSNGESGEERSLVGSY